MSPLQQALWPTTCRSAARWDTSSSAPGSCCRSTSTISMIAASEPVTIENALAWATLPAGDANWWAFRLSVVRGFASYLHAIDPAHEVPPKDLLPRRSRRADPVPVLRSGDPRADGGDQLAAAPRCAGRPTGR